MLDLPAQERRLAGQAQRAIVTARNLITDVAGVLVGHAQDDRLGSGVTAIVFEEPAVASIDVRGGGPGTREADVLEPAATVERIDGIALSGGSAFGLEAGAGMQAWLRERGRGFAVRSARVPIVPGAILFDLLAGGDKNWGRFAPYRELGYAAAENAAAEFALGSVGAGLGATTLDLKGGIGSAVAVTPEGLTVGAIAAVNAAGSVVIGGGPWFWAAPFEQDAEFGGLGLPAPMPPDALRHRTKGEPAREHHPGGGGDRCGADQGAGQAARRHGADRPRPRDLSGAHAARRRRGVRRRDRAQAAPRPAHQPGGARNQRRQCGGPRGGARRLCCHAAPFQPRSAELAGALCFPIYQVNSCCCAKAS